MVELFNLLFFVSFATGYTYSGEIKMKNSSSGKWTDTNLYTTKQIANADTSRSSVLRTQDQGNKFQGKVRNQGHHEVGMKIYIGTPKTVH